MKIRLMNPILVWTSEDAVAHKFNQSLEGVSSCENNSYLIGIPQILMNN